jgi:hypothetical protein
MLNKAAQERTESTREQVACTKAKRDSGNILQQYEKVGAGTCKDEGNPTVYNMLHLIRERASHGKDATDWRSDRAVKWCECTMRHCHVRWDRLLIVQTAGVLVQNKIDIGPNCQTKTLQATNFDVIPALTPACSPRIMYI